VLCLNGNPIYLKHVPEENDKELNGQQLFYEPMIFHNAWMMMSADEFVSRSGEKKERKQRCHILICFQKIPKQWLDRWLLDLATIKWIFPWIHYSIKSLRSWTNKCGDTTCTFKFVVVFGQKQKLSHLLE